MYSEIRGINIKQVIWKIILGWRYWLAASVILAIGLAGFKYASDINNYKKMKNVQYVLTDDEIKSLDSIIMKYDRLNYYEKYYEDSILLKIDTKQYDILVIQYYIESEYTMDLNGEVEKDYTPALVSAYSAYVLNNEYCKSLISELKLNASEQSVRVLTQVAADKEGSMFKLTISIPNGCAAEAMEKAIDKIVFAKQKDFATIGAHTLYKINSSVNRTFSDSLETLIYDMKKNISSVRNSIEQEKSLLTDAQKQYLYENIEYDEYREEFVSATISKPQVNVKFGLVGFVLGLFIVCALYLLKEVFSSKLQNEDDISNLYKINKMGVIRNIDGIKEKFVLDRVLGLIKNKRYKNYTSEDFIKYIAAKVEIGCKQNEVSELVLLETVSNSQKSDILEKLSSELKNKGIVCHIIENVLNDSDELEKVINISNVVVIGEIEKSYYSIIDESIMVLRQYEVNILGNVVIE